MSLSTKIFIGLFSGIAFGIFFGEIIQPIGIVGEAFIRLLQMSVLPFVMFSLITGVGRLTASEAFSLAKKCGGFLALLWVVAIIMVILTPMAYPNWESASFFSPSLVKEKESISLLELYIPDNPFYSLTNSIIPAVVIFSIFAGMALIHVKGKQALLENLNAILQILTKVTEFVLHLAPIGVFAISASAAGTMAWEDLGRLQVYLVTYIMASLFLTFWVLPGLVTHLTPFSYREVVMTIKDALITAFATGNLMVILPLLTEQGRELFRKSDRKKKEKDSVVGVIVPTAFTFPSTGLLLTLSFIPFASWYVGSSLSLSQYPEFLSTGIFSAFGRKMLAIPFLLDLLRLPADLFELFVTIDVFSGRFGTLLAAMHIWALALLGTCAMGKGLKFQWFKLLGFFVFSVILAMGVLGGTRVFLNQVLDPTYTKYESLVNMDLMYKEANSTVLESPPSPPSQVHSGTSRLDQILDRGSLRVCYLDDSLPWAFRNVKGELVGFDIELAHILANELKVSLEFVGLEREDPDKLDTSLNKGVCDVAMTGQPVLPGRTQNITYSIPYLDTTVAFLAKDYQRSNFLSWESIQKLGKIRIGIPLESQHYRSLSERLVPQAKFVNIDSPRNFFTQTNEDLDAMIFLAEPGSAWTVVYPEYSVVVPIPDPITIPLAFPMPHGEQELVDWVNAWILLKKKEKSIDPLFKYWILGQGAKKKEPRWSIVRNVLHLVD